MKWDLKAPAADAFAPSRNGGAASNFSRSASVVLPGPRGRTSSADGLQRAGVISASAAEAVRGCPPSIQAMTSTTNRTATTKENIS